MRKIPGYSNYLAGEDGHVYRLWHYKKPLNPPLRLKSFRNPCGYMQCGAIADADCPPEVGKPRRAGRPVHQLICLAFHGLPPSPRHEVDHINNVRDDNRPENLRWVTRRENVRNSKKHYTYPAGEKHHCAKINPAVVLEIRKRRARGELLRVIAADVGLHLATVHNIATGKTWRCVPHNAAHPHGAPIVSPP